MKFYLFELFLYIFCTSLTMQCMLISNHVSIKVEEFMYKLAAKQNTVTSIQSGNLKSSDFII